MKNWKKLSTLVLAMVLCLSISACGGDSGDGGETADAPAVLEDYAYDSAADASGYDTYIGNWVGTGDAENDTLEVTTTDGGMYFTIYYINDIKASGAARIFLRPTCGWTMSISEACRMRDLKPVRRWSSRDLSCAAKRVFRRRRQSTSTQGRISVRGES